MPLDFLIIGQGLAGSLLAWELLRRGCKIMLVDNGQENASQVAAGLINPITGMRWVKSPDIDYLLPAAISCYAALAAHFGQVFYVEKPMLRIFQTAQEAHYCQKRQQDPDYLAYWQAPHSTRPAPEPFAAPFGTVQQTQTGYLNTPALLACLKDFFIRQGCYRQANVDYQAISLAPVLHWQGLSPQRIIFCEGYHALHNPWFAWLPFQPAKGEILTVRHSSTRLPDLIINKGHWLLPTSTQQFRLGATFDRQNLDAQPTAAGKHALLAALQALTGGLASTMVIKHQANVRPCTLDKQPFIGLHPQWPQLALFNGFGAKGSLQIPWYSQRFADALLQGAPMPADVLRYKALAG